MNKPTPYEVFCVAHVLYKQQTAHPANWDSLGSYIPLAIETLKGIAQEIDQGWKLTIDNQINENTEK